MFAFPSSHELYARGYRAAPQRLRTLCSGLPDERWTRILARKIAHNGVPLQSDFFTVVTRTGNTLAHARGKAERLPV